MVKNNKNGADFKNTIDLIVKKIRPQKIILFGSRAGRKNKEWSDYDICLLKSGVVNKRKMAQDIYKMLCGCNIAMDIIVETPENYLKLKSNRFMIYSEIAKNGKVVYEK